MQFCTQRRLRGYALTAAGIAAATAATDASAQVIFTPLGPVDGLLDSPGDELGIDLNNDGTDDYNLVYFDAGPSNLNIKIEGAPIAGQANVTDEILIDSSVSGGNRSNPVNLPMGFIIDDSPAAPLDYFFAGRSGPTTNSDSGVINTNGGGNFQFTDGVTPEYIGLRTIIDGNTHYGWIGFVVSEFEDNGSDPDVLTSFVSGYAFNATPDAGLAAGVIPEPSAALLALGAAGLGMMRRRTA